MPAKKQSTQDEPLRIGVDLGTSRSAVAASNGKRKIVESYVGWPRDFVARKMLGEGPLFGEEALENRLSLDLVRPLENGVIREGTEIDEKAVGELVGKLVEMAEPRQGQPIHAAVGIPAEALKTNRRAIRDAVSDYADKLLVVSEPFAVAYGVGALDNAMVIDIGAGTVDLCIMHGTMPLEEDQRGLTIAGDFVDKKLSDLVAQNHPEADFNLNMLRRVKEKYGFVGGARKRLEVDLPVNSKPTTYNLAPEMALACEAMLNAISETAMDLVSRFDPEFQDRVKSNILLAGGGSQIDGIVEYLEDAMRDFAQCTFNVADDPVFAGANGALELANDMPEEYWKEES